MTINNVTGTECPTDIAKLLQALIDQKSTIDLDNLSSTGEAKFTALQNAINTNSSSITTINKTLATKLSAEVSKAQNGYIKFSNGVMMQWGLQANTQYDSYIEYFPTAFTSTNYSVVITDWVATSASVRTYPVSVNPEEFTKSSFRAWFPIGVNRGFIWIAIGC